MQQPGTHQHEVAQAACRGGSHPGRGHLPQGHPLPQLLCRRQAGLRLMLVPILLHGQLQLHRQNHGSRAASIAGHYYRKAPCTRHLWLTYVPGSLGRKACSRHCFMEGCTHDRLIECGRNDHAGAHTCCSLCMC